MTHIEFKKNAVCAIERFNGKDSTSTPLVETVAIGSN